MEFLIYVAIAVVSYLIGWHMRGVTIMMKMIKNPDGMIDLITQLKELNQDEAVSSTEDADELSIERVGNTLYAYTKDTNQFIAQGNSLDSLLTEAKKRFPDRKFFGNIAKDNSAKELA